MSARLVLIVLIALLPTMMFLAYSERGARDLRLRLMQDEAMRLALLVHSGQHEMLSGATQVLDVLGSVVALEGGNSSVCDRLSHDLLERLPRYLGVAVVSGAGQVVCSAGSFDVASVPVADPAFRQALAQDQLAIGLFTKDSRTQRPIIHLARPIAGNGAGQAYVALALSLEWVAQELAGLPLPAGAAPLVADRAGTILARTPNPERFVGTTMPPETLYTLKAMVPGLLSDLVGVDGRPRLAAYVPQDGLYVGVGLDRETAFAGIMQANRLGLRLIVAGLALALALTIWLGARLIRRPVRRLLDVADRWGAGDFAVRTGILPDDSEFGRLAAAFDSMAAALQTRETALDDSQDRLRLALQAAGMGFREIDIASHKASWSPEATQVLGFPLDHKLTMAEWQNGVHPDDLDEVQARREDAIRNPHEAYQSEYRFRQPDGSWRWIAVIGRIIVENGVPARSVAVVQDVTGRKQTEVALREGEARLRMSQEAGDIGSFDWDIINNEVFWSDVQRRQFGIDPASNETVTLDHWRSKIHTDDLSRVEAQIASALACGMHYEAEYRINSPRGVRWITSRARTLRDASGRAIRMTGIDLDITGRRLLEDALRRLTETLEARVAEEVSAREAAQTRAAQAERVQALGQLAGGIAHDFNNVLQVVVGAVRSIEKRPHDHERVMRLGRLAVEAADRGASITRRLLSFSRRADLRAAPVDLAELCHGLQELLTHTLGPVVRVDVAIEPGLPPVFVDKAQLETVLVNLAANARDAMPEGGIVTLSACSGAASGVPSPAELAQGPYIRLSVTDTGQGMAAATLARVGEPFFTTKPPGAGTGLGLPMAKGFAEQSGGAFCIESQVGLGTTVTLFLPEAETAITPDTPMSEAALTPSMTAATKKWRVMVVDDERLVRETLAQCLEDADFDVLQAAGGAEAIALMQAGPAFDALITDLSMPDIDGLAVIRAAQQRRPGMPTVLLTGYASEDAALALSGTLSGVVSLLRKPVSDVELIDRLQALFAA